MLLLSKLKDLVFLALIWIGLWCVVYAEAQQHSVPLCSPENLNLYNASNGEFFLQSDGSFRYQVHGCKLRKFRVTEAAKCLKGSHLVFMGDSLSRYFYLSLASLFSLGKWPPHFVSQYPKGRSFLSEKEYASWNWFFEDTNNVLNQGYHAMEVCDCYRNDSQPFLEFIRTMYENRHFRYLPRNTLDDVQDDVRLSYIQWWGTMPMRGHQAISLGLPRSSGALHFLEELNHRLCRRKGQTFFPLTRKCHEQRPELLQFNFPQFSHSEVCSQYPNATYEGGRKTEGPLGGDICQRFEKVILRGIGATHLILNTGWHSSLARTGPNFFPKLTSASQQYFPTPGNPQLALPRVTYRACTKGAVFENYDEIARNYSLTHGAQRLGFFSVGDITGKLRKIDDLLAQPFTDIIGAKLRNVVHVGKNWPGDRPLNNVTIPRIWHDTAHFEPYVYSEINNLFLNAVCPLSVTS